MNNQEDAEIGHSIPPQLAWTLQKNELYVFYAKVLEAY